MTQRPPWIFFAMAFGATGLLVGCAEEADAPRPIEIVRAQIEGVAFLEENRLDEAEAAFRRIVEMAPADPAGYGDLGLVHLRRGELAEARELLERAVDLDPNEPAYRLVLARILELEGDRAGARSHLEAVLAGDGGHARALFALARLDVESEDPDGWSRALPHLERLVVRTDGNATVRLHLIEALLHTGDADAAAAHLEELRRQVPVFPVRGQEPFETALDRSHEGNVNETLAAFDLFHDAMRTTGRYQQDLRSVEGPGGVLEGIPSTTFLGRGPGDADPAEVAAAIRFVDITDQVGLDAVAPRHVPAGGEPVAIAVGDLFENGRPDLYVGSGLLFRNEQGTFVEVGGDSGIPADRVVVDARFVDLSNDGRYDLYLARAGADILFRNEGEGRLRDATADAGLGTPGAGRSILHVDVDHDGDLDLVVVGAGPTRLYRNNLDGTFQESGGAMGLATASGGDRSRFRRLRR